jgi:Tol biopolymer transport system component
VVGEGAAQVAVARDGLLVYGAAPGPAADLALVWVDRKGNPTPLTETRRSYFVPRLSPDGKRLAVGIRASTTDSDIWIIDLERDVLSRLTSDGSSFFPVWTPDGRRVVFTSRREGEAGLFWRPADGSGPEERLTASTEPQYPHSFSPDGRLLAFDNSLPGDIWLLPLDNRDKAVAVLATPFREWGPRFSPDGRWLAYLSDESGRLQLCVRRSPNSGGSHQLSTGGATEPMWTRNGREIVYRADDRMMAVSIQVEPTFSVSKPKVLFEAKYEPGRPGISNYDLTPDGQRLVMVQGRQTAPEATLLTVTTLGPPR